MPQADQIPNRHPFQFSLRTMFVVTVVVALLCSGVFSPWEWLQSLTQFYLAVGIPMSTVVALIYSRGYARTFWIGAVFPASVFLLATLSDNEPFKVLKNITPDLGGSDDPDLTRFVLGLSILIALAIVMLTGLTAVCVRWMVESPQRASARQAAADAAQIVGNSDF
jgi:hypothetical protein